MNSELVKSFNDECFNQDDNESALLKIKYYNPPDLLIQHVPNKGKIQKIELNRKRNGYIVDTLTSVDLQKIVNIGGKIIEINAGVIYRANFRLSRIRKVIEFLFTLKQKYKDEGKDLMQNLVKLIMDSLYGVQIREDIDEFYKCKSQHRMKIEYDDNV